MVRPKKHLGQHFLTDPSIAARIVDALRPGTDRVVIEVGPGKGILTKFLLEKRYSKLLAVEIDSDAAAFLRQELPGLGDGLIESDFLKMDLSGIGSGVSVIGNFPYNVSSQIFFRILEYRHIVKEVVCMIQREVARRIVSPPGSKEYGILSVLLQAYYHTGYLFTVKPGSFFPPPNVVSAVIRLERNEAHSLGCDEKLFFRVVKTCFNQRRKTIRNSLKTILLNLEGNSGILGKRPEALSVNEFIELTNWVESRMGSPEHTDH
jgi:16S rRNA (adenine1518-N6/adenine1519-N6)-dimethyltransferase